MVSFLIWLGFDDKIFNFFSRSFTLYEKKSKFRL